MNNDDFLDKLLNASGDDLDRLIKSNTNRKKRKRYNKDIEVDMSDIEKILNSNIPLNDTSKENISKVVVISSNQPSFPDHSEECFKQIYDQLTTESYCIDRISAIQKNAQYRKRAEITSIVIKIILTGIGICICLGVAIWISQILIELFPG